MTSISHISAAPKIEQALRFASSRTGADFDYLLKTAVRESSLKSDAKSTTSSAKGLFQFIEQTWLSTLKKSGHEFGMGQLSNAIEQKQDGRFTVADPATRSAILALRDDPRTSALVAGAYTRDSAHKLQSAFGRAPSKGELYIAHFMGKNGAIELISEAQQSPTSIAADHFPQAAASNRSIFYTQSGRARNMAEVYHHLTAKHGQQPVQMAHLKSASQDRSQGIETESGVIQFNDTTHLSSHFQAGKKRGVLSRIFGAGAKSKTQPSLTHTAQAPAHKGQRATSYMYKSPTQILTSALVAQTQSDQENGARVHVASARIDAYQKQQEGAKVHNLFSSPSLRGAFR